MRKMNMAQLDWWKAKMKNIEQRLMNNSPVVQIMKTAGLLEVTQLGKVKKSTGLGKVKVMLGLW